MNYKEKTVKECPACGTINELNAKFCQECGHKFFKEGSEKPKEPAPQIVQEKKKEVKEEVKEKKKSFFSPTQIESIKKSEEEMKNKIVISLSNSLEKIIKVKAVEVREVQKVVYVADRANCHIQKFTSEGEFITKWGRKGSGDGEFYFPHGIAIDSQGNVYIADCDNHSIQKFTSEGDFITKWGSKGSGDGRFEDPFGIAIDSQGNTYVADRGNRRIQKFTSAGKFITKWGRKGSGDGEFGEAFGIAIDSQGNVYVVDTDNHRIQKFTSEGGFITKWGRDGSGDGEFESPYGIAISNFSQAQIESIRKSEEEMKNQEETIKIKAVEVKEVQKAVYVADRVNCRIQKFTSADEFITKWGSEGSDDGEFKSLVGIAISKI